MKITTTEIATFLPPSEGELIKHADQRVTEDRHVSASQTVLLPRTLALK